MAAETGNIVLMAGYSHYGAIFTVPCAVGENLFRRSLTWPEAAGRGRARAASILGSLSDGREQALHNLIVGGQNVS